MVLTEILKENAKKFPHAPALTMRMGFRTVTLTYKQVYEISRKIALLLEREGVGKGDKVILLAPNSPYWVCTFWGCLLVGAVAVPLNVQSTPAMVETIAAQVDPKLFFTYRYYRHETPKGAKRYNIDLIMEELEAFDPDDLKKTEVVPDDLVEILYTSGTTGDPKGVLLSHKNLYSNVRAALTMVSLALCKERMLSILPLSHIFEQAGMFLSFHYVAHTIYAHSHAAIGQLLHDYRITKMFAVPEFLKILMRKIEAGREGRKWIPCFLFAWLVRRKLGSKLDTVVCGGAPLDPELERAWNALGIRLLQGYGLTETSPLVTSNTYEYHRFGSVGKVAPEVSVRISPAGEIQVQGANVFKGYFKDEERTKKVFTDDGWFKTDDMGTLDEDGYLFLKGRKTYMILGPGGQNVFPEDIEEVLHTIKGVKESAVIGIEQEGGMVQIHAVFLLESGADDVESIVERANKKLASYQQITGHSIWPDDDFPRSATKKVKKGVVLGFLKQTQEKEGVVGARSNGVIALLAQVTGVASSRITLETKLSELHVDSLVRVELIARIEEQFEVLLDEAKLTQNTTVAQLKTMIRERKPVKGLPPLRAWPRSWGGCVLRAIGQRIIFLFMRTFISLRVRGLENLDSNHVKELKFPVVFMPNHLCYFDTAILVAALPRSIGKNVAFAAANDVLYEGYRWFVPIAELLFNAFPFPRKEGENIKLGLDYMGQLLDQGFSVAVFPEGEVSKTGELLPLKRGTGLVGVEMRVMVIPVKIEGSQKIFPYFKLFPRARGTVTVSFGKPIRFGAAQSYEKATETIERAMKSL